MTPAQQEKFDREFEEAAKRTMAFALQLAEKLYGGKSHSATDYAQGLFQEAVAQTLGGTRGWKPEEVPLWVHLCGTVRSQFSNEAASAQARTRGGHEWEKAADAMDPSSRQFTPEDYLLSQEASEAIEAEAYELAGQDPALTGLVQAIADGAYEIGAISAAAKMTAKEIYAAKEKLKRRRGALTKKRTS